MFFDIFKNSEETLQKIEDVANPIIGKKYLVKCAKVYLAYEIDDYKHWVPVFGELHDDKGIAQPQPHFHVDWRFMPKKYIREANESHKRWGWFKGEINTHNYIAITDKLIKNGIAGKVCGIDEELSDKELENIDIKEGIDIKYLPLKYLRNFQPLDATAFSNLIDIYKKKDIRMKNMICPHKKANLTSCQVIDGVVTCPCHGLKWNIETGKLAN